MRVGELVKALESAPQDADVADVQGVMIGIGEEDRALVYLVDEWPTGARRTRRRQSATNGGKRRGGWPKGKPRGPRKRNTEPPADAPADV